MFNRSENEIAIVAQFFAKDGKTAEMLAAIHAVGVQSLKEPGCVRFIMHQSVDNPSEVAVVEKFANQAAFDFHLSQPYTKNLLEVIVPELVDHNVITFHKEILF